MPRALLELLLLQDKAFARRVLRGALTLRGAAFAGVEQDASLEELFFRATEQGVVPGGLPSPVAAEDPDAGRA